MLIIWDVDDVLNHLMRDWFFFWQNLNHNQTTKFDELHDNPPHTILEISLNEYLNSLDEFRNLEKARSLEPNQHLLQWFHQYGSHHTHIALTARPLTTMSNQAWWVYKNFGLWIHTVAVVPAARDAENPMRFKKKAQYIEWLGKGDLFVDDNHENVAAVAKLGLQTLLYPQPWNNSRQSEAELIKQLTLQTEK